MVDGGFGLVLWATDIPALSRFLELVGGFTVDERHPGFASLSYDGARVVLRPPAMADYSAWAQLRALSRQHLTVWEPQWARDELSRGAFRRRLRQYQREARDDLGYAYFIVHKADGTLLGSVTLSNVRRGVSQTAAVGYWIGLPYCNKGFMTDAVKALTGHAFRSIGLHRLEAACMPNNAASARVLTKAGFRHEGVARKYLKIEGVWQDHDLYARLDLARYRDVVLDLLGLGCEADDERPVGLRGNAREDVDRALERDVERGLGLLDLLVGGARRAVVRDRGRRDEDRGTGDFALHGGQHVGRALDVDATHAGRRRKADGTRDQRDFGTRGAVYPFTQDGAIAFANNHDGLGDATLVFATDLHDPLAAVLERQTGDRVRREALLALLAIGDDVDAYPLGDVEHRPTAGQSDSQRSDQHDRRTMSQRRGSESQGETDLSTHAGQLLQRLAP